MHTRPKACKHVKAVRPSRKISLVGQRFVFYKDKGTATGNMKGSPYRRLTGGMPIPPYNEYKNASSREHPLPHSLRKHTYSGPSVCSLKELEQPWWGGHIYCVLTHGVENSSKTPLLSHVGECRGRGFVLVGLSCARKVPPPSLLPCK